MLKWRIYYSDDSIFDSTQGAIPNDKRRGLICIIFYDRDGVRRILHRHDFYFWISTVGQWSGGDVFGVLDRMLESLPLEYLCQGRSVSNKKFRAIFSRADHDRDFPQSQLS